MQAGKTTETADGMRQTLCVYQNKKQNEEVSSQHEGMMRQRRDRIPNMSSILHIPLCHGRIRKS
jgi:hypothetical protein